ncbi:MAG: hypothetical protein COU47_00690 [Candidatus Niyogibacteria bacterium CG10_big_fil_rev_8_21_14_0_10_46_36]|uniref:DUF2061 domain-containing protein n=1 Tax=Candidatus Niyogibacteria bacterium CG10_big_fil_rev_8_21_14_0_10_46_36 TaxID=1974726 RepID=A0A2H0TGJ8_9BACT|nr:MAG: hypothetical protein COU47_00690 [Candidatus Niyogibacteria bacterium CG10_big_fil_rev_8_21_14_0_10_46_36]
MRDSHTRSVLKGITYRIFATITTALFVFFITKNIKLSLSVGIFEIAAKILLFYSHERVWHGIRWGKF